MFVETQKLSNLFLVTTAVQFLKLERYSLVTQTSPITIYTAAFRFSLDKRTVRYIIHFFEMSETKMFSSLQPNLKPFRNWILKNACSMTRKLFNSFNFWGPMVRNVY